MHEEDGVRPLSFLGYMHVDTIHKQLSMLNPFHPWPPPKLSLVDLLPLPSSLSPLPSLYNYIG